MAKQLQLKRGTTAQHATFTGAVGEVTIDTDKDVVVVHDGATAGGFPSQKQLVSGTNIKTINDTSLLGSGNISIGVSSLSDTSISSPLSGQVLSYDGVNWANVTFSALPSQSGQSGKFLTTDGSTATWETIDALPSQTGNAGKFLTTDGTTASWGGSVVNGTSSRNTYTATAGQTTFSSTYDVGYVDVYRNGLKLAPSDFTATNGTTVVLNNACSLNDVVDIVAYGTFELADAYTKNDTDILLAAKQETLVSGTNIKTINSNNILGSGDISIPSLSGITAYHLLQGNLAVDNTVTTQGFNTTLYTGNSSTQSITTGIDMATQWGNDASEKFGGLVWLKCRNTAIDHYLFDTVRGTQKGIWTSRTDAEYTYTDALSSFTSTGFSLGANTGINYNTRTMTSWNFQTTHRVSGTTNHGKAYTCHYNPFTGFTIVKYEGSGIAGHEIPHHLGRKLGFSTIKNLTTSETYAWVSRSPILDAGKCLFLHSTLAQASGSDAYDLGESNCVMTSALTINGSGATYILYGWANSYFDEKNTLIGNYEVGVYQGTGASGNKVKTRGKPAWLMYKRLDSTSNWTIEDNQRITTLRLLPNLSDAESATNGIAFNSDGFTFSQSYDNVAGGQYLYMVAYDTNSNGGGSYYPRATDTSNLQIQNAIIPFANGIDTNGTKITTLSKNETISGLTLTAGKNYVYSKNDGTYGVSKYEPMYGSLRNRSVAGENPDYFDLKTMKWYGTSGGSELVTNGTFTSNTNGWTGTNATLSVDTGTLKVTNTSTNGYGYQTFTTVVGKKYKLSFNGISGSAYLSYELYDSTTLISSLYTYNGSKQTVVEFVAQSTSITLRCIAQGTVNGDYARFDNISLFETTMTPTTEITESRNYLNHIVYADNDGSPLYVEELPKVEYKDIIKANEYRGKNACTAWVNFNGQTTPPTIYDSYNVSKVIRTATGKFDIYLENNPVVTASVNTNSSWGGAAYGTITQGYMTEANKVYLSSCNFNGVLENSLYCSVQIFGGKNA